MVKSYKVFVNRSIILLTILVTLVFTVIPTLAGVFLDMITIAGVVTVTVLMIIVSVMVDFFCFGGIAVKKQKLMEYCKSSLRGKEIVKASLIGDVISVSLRMLFVSGVSFFLAELIGGGTISAMVFVFAISTACTGASIIYLCQLITRKFCTSLNTHMIVAYLITSLSSMAFIPAIMLFFSEGKELYLVIYTILIVLVFVGLAVAVVAESISGYKSGFYDI